jgi:hypothetical protein
VAASCPECDGPLVRGTFCRACGWDGEVMPSTTDEEYLDGVDLPQGYGGEEDGFDYEEVLRREGLLGDDDGARRAAPPRVSGAGVSLLLVAAIVIAFMVLVALLGSR